MKKTAFVVLIFFLVIAIASGCSSPATNKGNTDAESVSDTSQSKDNRVLVGHNGKTIYINDAQSETVKAVIANKTSR